MDGVATGLVGCWVCGKGATWLCAVWQRDELALGCVATGPVGCELCGNGTS